MDMTEIYQRLCSYDPRNPNFYLDDEDAKTYSPTQQQTCMCDNCFYGRNKLALEIIRLQELLTQTSSSK